jgi:hypothetical protein
MPLFLQLIIIIIIIIKKKGYILSRDSEVTLTTGKLRTAAKFVPNQQAVGDYREVSCAAPSFPISCVPFSCVFGFLPVLVPFRAPRNWVVPVRASSFIGLSPQWYNVGKGNGTSFIPPRRGAGC